MRKLTLVVAVLLALFGVGGTVAPASAHASLVGTDPSEGEVLAASPEQVTFTFNESVSLVPDGVLVFDATGTEVEAEDAAASDEVVTVDLPTLDDGTYVVTWRIVSADGHPVAGSLTFHVGAPSETVVAPDLAGPQGSASVGVAVAVVAAVDYVALFLVGGIVLFLAYTARGVRLHDDVRRRVDVVLRVAILAAITAALVAVPLAGAYQTGGGLGALVGPDVWDPALVRNDLTVLALHAVGLAATWWMRDRLLARAVPLTAAMLTALAVWSPALVGHTRASAPASLLVVTDALHLSAGAVWLGGLVALVLTLRSVQGRPRDAALLLSRFSGVAAGALLALAVSGTLLAWRILGSWEGLVSTTYGRLLLAKLAMALFVAAVAAWNRWRLLPRLAAGNHDEVRSGVALVRRAVRIEAVGLVAVIAVTGFLTDEPPGGSDDVPAAGSTGTVSATTDDYRVLAVLDEAPGRRRVLTVQVQDATGEPIDLYQAPSLTVRNDQVDLGEVALRPTGAGTYVAEVVFPQPGTWQAQVSVRIDRFTTPVVSVDLNVD